MIETTKSKFKVGSPFANVAYDIIECDEIDLEDGAILFCNTPNNEPIKIVAIRNLAYTVTKIEE